MLGEGALGCRRRAIDAKAPRRIALTIGFRSMAELQDLAVCLQFDETAKPPGPSCLAQRAISARRSPRPGENIESASRILVFPAPFSPVSAMVLEPNRASSAA